MTKKQTINVFFGGWFSTFCFMAKIFMLEMISPNIATIISAGFFHEKNLVKLHKIFRFVLLPNFHEDGKL